MGARWGVAALAVAMMGWMLPAQAATLAGERVPHCSWDRPGHNPFTGDVVAALDRYADIPSDVRQRLQQRMARRQYDDLVSIRRDSIEGRHRYDARIRDMHFGERRVCGDVTRAEWTAQMQERGLVYCDSGHCILVPTVCRNVSRIARLPEGVSGQRAEADEEPAGSATPLAFDPPAAGAPSAPHEGPSFEETVHGAPGWAAITAAPTVPLPPLVVAAAPTHEPTVASGWAVPLPPAPGLHLPTPPVTPAPVPPVPTSPVPDAPSAWLLLGGLAALVARQRRAAGRASCSTQKRS
jgi:MYXO-CTERM domain-containing protein